MKYVSALICISSLAIVVINILHVTFTGEATLRGLIITVGFGFVAVVSAIRP